MSVKTRGAVRFSRNVARLLRKAMLLKERKEKMSALGYVIATGRIEASMDRLLSANLTDPDNRRLAKRLHRHRLHLFTFLYNDEIGATNNAAERALRPAVIARKLSGCNRTERGARTHSILASVIQTCRQQGKNFLSLGPQMLRSSTPQAISLMTRGP